MLHIELSRYIRNKHSIYYISNNDYYQSVLNKSSSRGVNTFAQRLLYARQLRGYTQSKLAALCGISQSTIASYETGTRLHARNLLNLAKTLKVNPSWLEQGLGAMSPTLQEAADNYSSNWPFTRVSPDDLHHLSEQQLITLETVIQTLLDSWAPQKK